ncbi:MAG: hypothetical protein F9K24_14775 [Leptonema illini]|jgi:hypothetical protein|uniref:Uncharacterized protein n=1 Tax=Leptonema illini TaxID=183 RepID=A0A833LWH3_9LEPT|nr:MAG: hypothetical protein F9K24_14775 [Leptonema illini]
MNPSNAEIFLISFFQLFDATIKECKVEGMAVTGRIFWGNDRNDTQSFRWHIEVSGHDIDRMISLCDVLHKNNLVSIDRLTVTEPELVEKLRSCNWEMEEIECAINALMSTEVKMVDDGEETDSFYIHF